MSRLSRKADKPKRKCFREEKDQKTVQRDPFFTHPPKLQACKDNVNIGTEKADHLGEFNDMLVGARPPKVQKARILTLYITSPKQKHNTVIRYLEEKIFFHTS
jgi:hypothetical protein